MPIAETVKRIIAATTTESRAEISRILSQRQALEVRLVARDILYYGVMLQDMFGYISSRDWLISIGMAEQELFDQALAFIELIDSEFSQHIDSVQAGQYKFSQELCDLIRAQFEGEGSLYRLESPLPGTKLTGKEFLRLINLRTTDGKMLSAAHRRPLAGEIANVFKTLLGIAVEDTRSENLKVLRGTSWRGQHWSLILGVYPSFGPFDTSDLANIFFELTFPFQQNLEEPKEPPTNVLLVIPSISEKQAKDINELQRYYAMWDHSLLRFIVRFEEQIKGNAEGQSAGDERKRIAALFPHLLEPGVPNSHAYMEGQALNALFKRLDMLIILDVESQQILTVTPPDQPFKPIVYNGEYHNLAGSPVWTSEIVNNLAVASHLITRSQAERHQIAIMNEQAMRWVEPTPEACGDYYLAIHKSITHYINGD